MQVMRSLMRGRNGAQAMISPPARELPKGLLSVGYLDGALHCIPHDNYTLWDSSIASDMVGFPIRIENLRLYGSLDISETVEVHARFAGCELGRLPKTHLRIIRNGKVLVAFDLIEMLLPKGKLGKANGEIRRAFLRDCCFFPGLALTDTGSEFSVLAREDVKNSDWLPGTVGRIYRIHDSEVDLAREVARKDHAGQILGLHPARIKFDSEGNCLNLPLNRFIVSTVTDHKEVRVKSGIPEILDCQRIIEDWSARNHYETGLAHDIGMAMIRCFVRRVVLADPEGFAALSGKPVLYLANHQTGVESFLFLTIITSLLKTPAGAIAKKEHRESWIGLLLRLAALEMGKNNPMQMLLFDRNDQSDMLRLLHGFTANLHEEPRSLLVHVDGTRAKRSGAPVRAVTSVLIDLAVANGMLVVPVRFAGGLPCEEGRERFEFPCGFGQQDYFIGEAIQPETLKSLPYARRGVFVSESINRLGPNGDADLPVAGSSEFVNSVTELQNIGFSEVAAVLRAGLRNFPTIGEITRNLLDENVPGISEDRLRIAMAMLNWK